MAHPRYPALYQVNTRVWLHQLEVQIGRLATLDDFPDEQRVALGLSMDPRRQRLERPLPRREFDVACYVLLREAAQEDALAVLVAC